MHEFTPVLSRDIIEFRLGSGWEIEMLLGVSAWFRAQPGVESDKLYMRGGGGGSTTIPSLPLPLSTTSNRLLLKVKTLFECFRTTLNNFRPDFFLVAR